MWRNRRSLPHWIQESRISVSSFAWRHGNTQVHAQETSIVTRQSTRGAQIPFRLFMYSRTYQATIVRAVVLMRRVCTAATFSHVFRAACLHLPTVSVSSSIVDPPRVIAWTVMPLLILLISFHVRSTYFGKSCTPPACRAESSS